MGAKLITFRAPEHVARNIENDRGRITYYKETMPVVSITDDVLDRPEPPTAACSIVMARTVKFILIPDMSDRPWRLMTDTADERRAMTPEEMREVIGLVISEGVAEVSA